MVTGKRFKILFILIFVLFVLSGCSGMSGSTSDGIEKPQNKAVPLQGNWVVSECFPQQSGRTTAGENKWTGIPASFSGDTITFGSDRWENVNYKIKRVNAAEYFLHKYQGAVSDFGIKDKDILVITASSEDKFLYDFIRVSDDRIVVFIDNEYYLMKRAAALAAGAYMAPVMKGPGDEASNVKADDTLLRSGLLMGLRIPAETGQPGKTGAGDDYIYRTYWISSVNFIPGPVLMADDIFLPRKDGFWRLRLSRDIQDDRLEDCLHASTVAAGRPGNDTEGVDAAASDKGYTRVKKTILYVGNDYVCVENATYGTGPDGSAVPVKKVLRTLPVDNLENTEGITISDLAGASGSLAMKGAITDLPGFGPGGIKNADENKQEENYALFRKTGHWFFMGRLDLAENETPNYMDFNINLIPPSDMVAYDTLQVPWTVIKDNIPQALDAYTSPNKDIAVVLTQKSVLVFKIDNGKLPDKPIEKFDIAAGSSVVMAEWATGDYVVRWQKAFVNNNDAKPVTVE